MMGKVDYKISGRFYDKRKYGTHGGIDIAVPSNTKIYAPCSGSVLRSDTAKDAGRILSISCNGYDIQFLHLASFSKVNLDSVQKGEEIGLTGAEVDSFVENYTSGPHLHLQIKQNTKLVVIEEKSGKIDLIVQKATQKVVQKTTNKAPEKAVAKAVSTTPVVSGNWHISTYYSPVYGQAKYFNGTWKSDVQMNCGLSGLSNSFGTVNNPKATSEEKQAAINTIEHACLTPALAGVVYSQDMANKYVACGSGYKKGTRFKITMPSNHKVHPGQSLVVTCVDRGGAVDNKQLDLWAGIGSSSGYPWIGEWSTNKAIVEVLK